MHSSPTPSFETLRFGFRSILITLGFLFLMGCSTRLQYQVPEMPELPENLDAYLSASEAVLGNVRPGAEKLIVWADPARKTRTPLAIVYLHGFSASRREMAPVCDNIAAQLGANIFYSRLNGHGQDDDAMGEATLNAWLADGTEALAVGKRIGDKVILMGMSTGATLAAWMATQSGFKPDIDGLVLFSPNFHPKSKLSRIARWPGGEGYMKMIFGEYRQWEPQNEQVAAIYTTHYPSKVLVPMMEMVDLLGMQNLETLTAPILILYNENDQVISVSEIKSRFKQIGSPVKELVPFLETDDPWGHVLAGDASSPRSNEAVTRIVLEFIESIR